MGRWFGSAGSMCDVLLCARAVSISTGKKRLVPYSYSGVRTHDSSGCEDTPFTIVAQWVSVLTHFYDVACRPQVFSQPMRAPRPTAHITITGDGIPNQM